jgi:hypothetical protein
VTGILRLLGVRGVAGIAVSLALGVLLLIQKAETRHWKKESARLAQLYAEEQAARAATAANYRAAADAARAADRANLARVAAEQRAITERTSNDYEARLAAARTLARRLRGESEAAAADRGRAGAAPMPGLPAPVAGAAQTATQDRFSVTDRELATEQAIQLDELIKWVRQQHAVRVDGVSGEPSNAAGAQVKPPGN